MAFDNKTNHSRVAKIIDTLDLIEASRVSNKASTDEMDAILKPLIDRIGKADFEPTSIDETPKKETKNVWLKSNVDWTKKTAGWAIRDAAANAKIQDLTFAIAVLMGRIDEEVGSGK